MSDEIATTDYSVSDDVVIPTMATPRWDAGIEAIRTLKNIDRKNIEIEGCKATLEEQKVLFKYSGFGGSAFGSGSVRKWGLLRFRLPLKTPKANGTRR